MKKIILFCLITLSMNSFGQLAKSELPKPGVITGNVVDESTKEPLPYVNIVVMDMNRQTITGGITNEKGEFKTDSQLEI